MSIPTPNGKPAGKSPVRGARTRRNPHRFARGLALAIAVSALAVPVASVAPATAGVHGSASATQRVGARKRRLRHRPAPRRLAGHPVRRRRPARGNGD